MRENTVHLRPPRALWVPFDLGRPFGVPDDPAFQTDVLRNVLALFERTDGPVILVDFDKNAPDQGNPENLDGMVCPVPLRKPATSEEQNRVQQVLGEIEQLAPWQTRFRETNGRSTVGVCPLPLRHAVGFLGDILANQQSGAVPPDDFAATLRFACEDLRNFYLEAASMRPGGTAPRAQLIDWFWGETEAGALLLALHPVCGASSNPDLQRIAEKSLIPRAQQHRL